MAKPEVKPEPETDPDADVFEGLDEEDARSVDLSARARVLAHRRIERASKPPEKKKRRGFLS
jgi:hypothetical protein